MIEKIRERYLYFVFYFFAAILIGALVVGELTRPAEDVSSGREKVSFNDGWEWVKNDGTRQKIEVPCKEDIAEGETFVIERIIPELDENGFLFFRGSQQTVYFYVDGVIRDCYDTKNSRFGGNNSASAYIKCKLYPEDAGKTLRIELTTFSSFTGLVNELKFGDLFDHWHEIIVANSMEMNFCAFSLILGISAMIVGSVLRRRYRERQPIEIAGWIILLAAVVIFSEGQIRQLIMPNTSVLADITYFAVLLMVFAILAFMDLLQNGRYHKYYLVAQWITVLMAPVILILLALGAVEIYKMLTYIIIWIVVCMVIYIINNIRDVKQGIKREYGTINVGIVLFMLLALIGNFIVNTLDVMDSVGVFLSIGIFCFLVPCVFYTVKRIGEINSNLQREKYEQAAKAQFFASVSHEIRTPINGIIGMNEMILRESESADIREYARNIEASGKTLLSIVNDLLDYTKAGEGKLELYPADYHPAELLIELCSVFAEEAAKKDLVFRRDIDENMPSVMYGDVIRVKQILTNLIGNSIKYTKDGYITFKVWGENEKDRYVLCASVSDTGVGIKKEDISKIFESFTRVDEEKNKAVVGSGLGLAVTKSLVTMMGGSIDVQSEYGKGSVFTLRIPQKVVDMSPMGNLDSVMEKKKAVKNSSKLRAEGAKILAVDDNKMNLVVLKGLLKASKASITTVMSGKAAVDICRDQKFDIVLMDHRMPEMDGVEATHLIRNDENGMNREVAIIALTANAYPGIEEYYRGEGFEDYLAKPVIAADLEEMLVKYIPDAGYLEDENE